MADGNMETLSIGLNLDISQFDENTQKALRNIQQISASVTKANSDISSSSSNASSNVGDLNKNLDKTGDSGKNAGNGINAAAVNMAAAIKIIETIIKVVQKLIGLVKACTDAADQEYIALTKLNTILGNVYKVNSDYTNSLFSYIKAMEQAGAVSSDALVQATQTLSSYTTSLGQLEDLLPAVADLTASLYGTNATAQNAQTLATAIGRALNGSTEALTRYGVQLSQTTKDILKSDTATQAEKVAAIVADIEGRVGGMNEALGKTYRGQINQIKAALQDIKQNIGYIFENFITPVLPVLKAWVLKLKEISAILVEVSKILTGVDSQALTNAGEGMAEGLSDANEEADKLSGKLLSFDKFNALDPTEGEEDEQIDTSMVTSLMQTFNDMTDVVEKAREIIAELDIPGIIEGIKKAIEPAWSLIKNIISALGEFFGTLGKNLSSMFERLGGFFDSLQATTDAVSTLLKPVLRLVYQILDVVIDVISALFKSKNASDNFKKSWDLLAEAITEIIRIVSELIEMLRPFLETVAEFIGQVITSLASLISRVLNVLVRVIGKIWDALKPVIDLVFKLINSALGTVLEAIGEVLEMILGVIGDIFETLEPALDFIMPLVNTIVQLLMEVLAPVFEKLKAIISAFSGWFKDSFGTMTGIVKEFVNIFKALMEGDLTAVFKGVGNIFVRILNGICNGFKSFIDWIIDCLNWSIEWLNDIIEFFGGDRIGIPKTDSWGWKKDPIPYFAEGGLPDKGSLFVANEAGPELVGNIGGVSAVANNKMIVDAIEEASYRGFTRALAGAGGNNVNLVIDGSAINDSAFVRAIMPAFKTEVKRKGGDSSVFGK